jgi:hypothetical protein
MEFLTKEAPFPHVLTAGVLSAAQEAQVLSKLEEWEWKDWGAEFFRIRISANADQLANFEALPALKALVSNVRPALETKLKKSLSRQVRLAVQMYEKNSAIGFHTDEAVSEVRFVLNLNRSWTLSNGGIWILSMEPTLEAASFLPPLSNTGFAFATNSNSFHALSRRSTGPSYAIVTSYPILNVGVAPDG